MKIKTLLTFALLGIFVSSMCQDTIRITTDQPSIQAGINAASNGDVILVENGVYYENINFKGKALTVCSEYLITYDSTDIINTVINGSQPGHPDSASVVYFISGETNSSVLAGFTITGGGGTPILGGGRCGGGILCLGAGPLIEHNLIIENECVGNGDFLQGGGIFTYLTEGYTPWIRFNKISGNSCASASTYVMAITGGGISVTNGDMCIIEHNEIVTNSLIDANLNQAVGGGIEIYLSGAVIRNNIIRGNIAQTNSAYYNPWGGGIYAENNLDSLIISGNTICDNSASSATSPKGGGLGIYGNLSALIIDKNIIKTNQAFNGGGASLGILDDATITNNVFQGNASSFMGGGLSFHDPSKSDKRDGRPITGYLTQNMPVKAKIDSLSPVMANNTIIENTATNRGGALMYINTDPLVAFNNIIHNNPSLYDLEIYLSVYSAYFYHNNLDTNHIYGTWQGENNNASDPMFEDDSCHLSWNSLCIGCGLESVDIEGTLYYCPDHDMDGEERPQAGGVDIGADETVFWVGSDAESIPDHNLSVYPNPSNGNLNFSYGLKEAQYVNVSIYTIQGKVIKTLFEGNQKAGIHNISGDLGDLPAGLYLYGLKSGEQRMTGKLIKK